MEVTSIESRNVNAGWQNFQFKVQLENFRHGGITIENWSGLRIETSAYQEGGNLE